MFYFRFCLLFFYTFLLLLFRLNSSLGKCFSTAEFFRASNIFTLTTNHNDSCRTKQVSIASLFLSSSSFIDCRSRKMSKIESNCEMLSKAFSFLVSPLSLSKKKQHLVRQFERNKNFTSKLLGEKKEKQEFLCEGRKSLKILKNFLSKKLFTS